MDFKKPFTFFKFLIIAISVLLINVGLPQGIYRGDSVVVGDGLFWGTRFNL